VVSGSRNRARVAADLNHVDGIHGAVAPSGREWNRDGTHIVEAIPIPDSGTSQGHDTLTAVRDTAHSAGAEVKVGGGPAANQDFIDAVYGSFPPMIALI